ncbi:hypothetical protein GSI_13250 [Ganoderma sinense ZZ0214-1]|uniref:DNA 3'-5' helicase n=1 Tax=Ganoderma sinense ZZ0214-1 TaxID=1077348 RepID=A0A2G8RV21_9APHY|nr:hypothetical protein GSI_13250 [Ganoderma sinense ZZ0214-1]
MTGAPASFVWSSPEGYRLARTILRPSLPFDPHDYQLEGVCKVLDGYDLLAVIPTGAGKTGYLLIYILLLIALSNNPNLCSPARTGIPRDPGMLIAYPTIGLEEEMAIVFERFKVKTLVINSNTLQVARRERRDLWSAAVQGYSLILLSPELLSSPGFETLLQRPTFQARLCALGVDEVHLLNSWGTGFRKAFLQLGYMRARMRETVRLIGLSASILAGQPLKSVCEFLGLRGGQFYFLQRSNIRPELQLLFRPLSHGLGGWKFPDFRWILDERRKTVIFCRTIALSFRLACYLLHLSTSSPSPIRLYNSLNWPSYNTRTRELMRNDPNIYIIIATASFMVGVDLPNIQDVILVQEPENADEWVQWGGRAGRDSSLVKDARVITYVTKKGPKTAQSLLEGDSSGSSASAVQTAKKGSTPAMDVSSAKVIIAQCKVAAQNELYNNPARDEPCTCATCTVHPRPPLPIPCKCSGCTPEASTMNVPPQKPSGKTNPVPRSKRLTRVMRRHGTQRLEKLREEIYDSLEDSASSRALPPTVYLPQPVITSLLDNFALLLTVDDLRALLLGRTYVLPHINKLWLALQALRPEFDDIRIKAAEERKRKAAEKAAQHAAAASKSTMTPEELEAAMQAVLDEDSEESDDGLDFFRQPRNSEVSEATDTDTRAAAQICTAETVTPNARTEPLYAAPHSDMDSTMLPPSTSDCSTSGSSSLSVLTAGLVPLTTAGAAMNTVPRRTRGQVGGGSASTQIRVEAVEEGPGYAMHILTFGGSDADPPPQARRKRAAPQKVDQAGNKPPRKRRRTSDKENCVP